MNVNKSTNDIMIRNSDNYIKFNTISNLILL